MIYSTDLETWLHNIGESKIFRILEYRKPGLFTPYEMENKFIDQPLYKDNHYEHIQIKEAILLPDNDILVGYRVVYDFDSLNQSWDESIIYYKKLSEIELSCFPDDQKLENWE